MSESHSLKHRRWLLVGLGVWVFLGCAQLPRKTDIPDLRWQITPEAVEPGHLARIQLQTRQAGVSFELKTLKQTVTLLPVVDQPGHYEGFLAVPIRTLPGPRSLTLTAQAGDALPYSENRSFVVRPRSPFKTTRLWIKSISKYDYGSESRLMSQARQQSEQEQGGSRLEQFSWPVTGRISEVFGVKRIYNQGEKSWYHGGLDIAAPGGTPVVAPWEGSVILTEPFEAHGNTVLVDHGFGVVSTYLHMKQIHVSTGQQLSAGDIIGEVGTTGASTGNHLHFQINVNGIQVDPRDFLDNKI